MMIIYGRSLRVHSQLVFVLPTVQKISSKVTIDFLILIRLLNCTNNVLIKRTDNKEF